MAEEIWDIVKLVPPITRTFVAAVSVLSLCCQLEFVSPYDLYFHWPLVYKDFQVIRWYLQSLGCCVHAKRCWV